ncbi:MAG: Tat pathway signal protein [Comamonadaceae bacterium]|nr:Tat pathway signal protein [Comamonadaceae bacterium]
MLTRRHFTVAATGLLGSTLTASGCSPKTGAEDYEAVATQTWRHDSPLLTIEGPALGRELVRYATLAPSSHNTQCWKFSAADKAITILADLSRRCPAVDPDDHHLFESLGCAAENLVQAALAHGLRAQARFDAKRDAVSVSLSPVPAQTTALFNAITSRQCTRGDYDGKPVSAAESGLLEKTGSSNNVRLLMMTERSATERVLEQVVAANTAQMADPAFVKELKAWIRFNAADAVRTRDGLFSATTGNPNIPGWLGQRAFGWLFTTKSENDKYARQIRSSSGIAVFVGQAADKAHWVEVGRCYERFALQATALGIRNAFVNQPVELAATRPDFASAMGLAGQRPDLVVRFGRGPAMPQSLRRSVNAVLV